MAQLARLLSTTLSEHDTYLPGSRAGLACHQELLVLLWKFVDLNPAFDNALKSSPEVLATTRVLLWFLWTGRTSRQDTSMVHLCTFLLLRLSGHRSFGVALNAPLPASPGWSGMPLLSGGNHMDMLVVVLQKQFVDGIPDNRSLHSCFLTILHNTTPYCRTLGPAASAKLVSLAKTFASPRYLLRAEAHMGYLSQMVHILNNLLQYQYAGSAHVVYGLVREHEVFQAIPHIQLPIVTQASAAAPAPSPAPSLPHSTGGESQAKETATVTTAAAPGWKPTGQWLDTQLHRLPLVTLQRLLEYMAPRLQEEARRLGTDASDETLVKFIRDETVVGVLPVPHRIIMHRYRPNNYTHVWFSSFLWGVIYLRNTQVPMFDSRQVKLFELGMTQA